MDKAMKVFGKGCGCLHIYNPYTNDLLRKKDNLKTSELAITSNEEEVTSGIGNTLDILLLDSTKVQVNLTTSDVDNIMRGMSMGSLPSNGGRVLYNEILVATGGKITLSREPVVDLGAMSGTIGARVSGKDATGAGYFEGKFIASNSGNLKEIQSELFVEGENYSVEYSVWDSKAQTSSINTLPSPMVVRVVFTQPLFATESVSAYGSRVGQDTYTIPLGILTPVMTIGGDQTAASTTTFTIRGIKYEEIDTYGVSYSAYQRALNEAQNHKGCDSVGKYKLAYTTREIWSNSVYYDKVNSLVVPGGMVSVQADQSKLLPLKELLNDGTTNVPTYSDYSYTSNADGTATVSPEGVVTGVASGNTTIDIVGKGEGFAPNTLKITVAVTVTE